MVESIGWGLLLLQGAFLALALNGIKLGLAQTQILRRHF